jgi:hypothetical protein
MNSVPLTKKYVLTALVGLFFIIGLFGIPHTAHATQYELDANDFAYLKDRFDNIVTPDSGEIQREANDSNFYFNNIKAGLAKVQRAGNTDAANLIKLLLDDANAQLSSQSGSLKDFNNAVATLRAALASGGNGKTPTIFCSFASLKTYTARGCIDNWVGDVETAKGEIYDQKQKIYQDALSVQKILDATVGGLDQNAIQNSHKLADQAVSTIGQESCLNSWNVPTNMPVCIREALGWVGYVIIVILAALLWVAGVALDQIINLTVIHAAASINGIESIGVMWQVFRDLANLVFIFMLLYVAIATILQVNGVNWKRILVQIVIAAILLNFSLFIAKVVIDISNMFAVAFYNKMVPPGSLLSSQFMDKLGLANLWQDNGSIVQTWSQSWASLIGSIIGIAWVIFVAAFSFFAAAWLFIYRFVVIILILVVSPIAFAGTILPATKKYASRWWDALIGQALFPPLYMLFVWLAMTIAGATGSNGFLGQSGDLKNAFNTSVDTTITKGTQAVSSINSEALTGMNVLIRFVVIIALLNAALIIAKSQASRGAGAAGKAMNWGLGIVDSTRRKAKGVATRNLINRPARGLRKAYNERLAVPVRKFAGEFKNVSSIRGTTALANKITDATENSNNAFVRGLGRIGSGAVRKTSGAITKGVGTGIGYAGKAVDYSINKKAKEYETERYGGDMNLTEVEKAYKERGREVADAEQKLKDEAAIKKGIDLNLSTIQKTDDDLIKAAHEFTKTVSDMSVREIEEQKTATLTNKNFLAALSQSNFDATLKSDKLNLSDQDKQLMKDNREAGLLAWMNSAGLGRMDDRQRALKASDPKKYNFSTFEEMITKKKPQEIADMPAKVLVEMAQRGMLTAADLGQIRTKGNMGKPNRNQIRQITTDQYTAKQREIQDAIRAARDRLARAYMQANPGTTLVDARKQFKKSKRVTEKDVDQNLPLEERVALAERYETLRNNNDFFTGNRGADF